MGAATRLIRVFWIFNHRLELQVVVGMAFEKKRLGFKLDGQRQAASSAVRSYITVASQGFVLPDFQLPSLSVLGTPANMSNSGHVDLSCLFRSCPQLLGEWQQLRESPDELFGPLPADCKPLVGDALLFLHSRCALGRLGPGHLLVGLRNMLLDVLAFGVELFVSHKAEHTNEKSEGVQLFTKTGRIIARNKVQKLRWLNKINKLYGSREAILAAMSDGKKRTVFDIVPCQQSAISSRVATCLFWMHSSGCAMGRRLLRRLICEHLLGLEHSCGHRWPHGPPGNPMHITKRLRVLAFEHLPDSYSVLRGCGGAGDPGDYCVCFLVFFLGGKQQLNLS